MNCEEVGRLAPLYLTGELNAAEYLEFKHHLAGCGDCQTEIDLQIHLDARLRTDLGLKLPDDSQIRRRVQICIAQARATYRWVGWSAAAAGILIAFAWKYDLPNALRTPRFYADAAGDHVSEVVEGQPRKWRYSAADIQTVAARDGVTFAQVVALAPAGYFLERAKLCGLDGERMLHLVYVRGGQRYSVFLRPDTGAPSSVRIAVQGAEHVAAFQTGRFKAVLVTEGADCEALARMTAARL